MEVSLIALGKVTRKLGSLFKRRASQTSESPAPPPSQDQAVSVDIREPSPTANGVVSQSPQPDTRLTERPPARRRRRRRPPAPATAREDTPSVWQGEDGHFGEMTVSGPIAHALEKIGYTAPTPVQEQVIPLARAGRDIIGQAQTGTGKTAAFGIPLVEGIDLKAQHLQALVLTPTRELAVQVSGEISRLGQFSGIRCVTVYGGQSMNQQLVALKRGAHIIVATPGRLMDHMGRGTVRLDRLNVVVLDEADQMLDIGFAEDIERILRTTPRTRQTLLFSATMPGPIKRLVHRYLNNPAWVRVGGDAEPVEQVEQLYYEIAAQDRPAALENLLVEPGRITQALIFRRTKIGVDKLVRHLQRQNYDAEAIHGDMPQSRRESVMNRFRARQLRILVATNVAARGLDIPAVSHVINYDMPSNLEEYVHRIGRTARMGRPGTAITFVSDMLDFSTLDIIQAHVGDDLKRERMAFLYG